MEAVREVIAETQEAVSIKNMNKAKRELWGRVLRHSIDILSAVVRSLVLFFSLSSHSSTLTFFFIFFITNKHVKRG